MQSMRLNPDVQLMLRSQWRVRSVLARIASLAPGCLAGIFLLNGCVASQQIDQLATAKITDPKIVALDAPSTPWVTEIDKRLRTRGFRVLRSATRSRVTEVHQGTIESYNASEARYVVTIDGSAPLDPLFRCFGGGYDFSYINVAVVDTKTNETLLNASDAGYSENCPPLSSRMFGDIADAIAALWN